MDKAHSGVPYIIRAVRKARPKTVLRSDGGLFWIEDSGEIIGKKRTTTDRAWRSAFEFIQSADA